MTSSRSSPSWSAISLAAAAASLYALGQCLEYQARRTRRERRRAPRRARLWLGRTTLDGDGDRLTWPAAGLKSSTSTNSPRISPTR